MAEKLQWMQGTVFIDCAFHLDSMCLYQFLIAIRTGGPDGGLLANEAGEITRYIDAILNLTVLAICKACGVAPFA